MSLRDLARDQRMLREETAAQADRLEPIPAFSAALASAGDQMELAAILLEQKDESTASQRQQDALRRLEQLLEALQPPPAGAGDNQQPGEGGNSGPQQQRSGDGIPRIAQLRLLKMLQEALNLETRDLDAELQASAQAGMPLSSAQRSRFDALAKEQGRLADLILDMSRPQEDDPLQDLQTPDNGGRE